jgi:L-threonylcarbamoyladenylate synthase
MPGRRSVDDDTLARAVAVLRDGGLVAFPTETVYGLGADAANAAAVERLYAVKGRPPGHPVIVHVADVHAVDRWASAMPAEAEALAYEFWPGPLTLILPRREGVPDVVTGGRPTVGLRVPAEPIALALLHAFDGGLAAPSANRFGRVSPTTADHVRADLAGDVDLILDGGPCAVGIESTIVDCSGREPVVLRPGGVPLEGIAAVLGRTVRVDAREGGAPGTLASHYRPRARVEVVSAEAIGERRRELAADGRRVVLLVDVEPSHLYARLREADAAGVDVILAVLPDEAGLGAAVADRLRRAAAPVAGDDREPAPSESGAP